MFPHKNIISLSDRFTKKENDQIIKLTNEENIYLKNKNSLIQRSIDLLRKPEPTKLKEITKIDKNKCKLNKYQQIRKAILSKKYILEQLLQEKNNNALKNKTNIIFNNNNNYFNYINSFKKKKNLIKGTQLMNNISMPELNINKKNSDNIKNEKEENEKNKDKDKEDSIFNIVNLNIFDNYKKINSRKKQEQINNNKTALFRKIKFASLKRFCFKDIKFNNRGVSHKFTQNFCIQNNNGHNISDKNNSNNKNSDINNNNEIAINLIKTKVRNYFIGKFNSIKEYFNDWKEKGKDYIDINDLYKYLNNKIKFKISKDEASKLFGIYIKKNNFDENTFKYLFFEEQSKKKLSIHVNKLKYYNQMFIKSLSDGYLSLNCAKNNNIIYYEKHKYYELLNLVKEHKNKLLKKYKENEKEEGFNYNEFLTLINSILNESKKSYYESAIKKLFEKYKSKNTETINIISFFEKFDYKKDKLDKNSAINNNIDINFKKQIYSSNSTLSNKIKNTENILYNYKNSRKSNAKKDTIFNKSNFLEKTNQYNKDSEESKINKFSKIDFTNNSTRQEIIKEQTKIGTRIQNIKFKTNRNDNFNSRLNLSHQSIDNKKSYLDLDSKIIYWQFPKITKEIRKQNLNSDIIDLL